MPFVLTQGLKIDYTNETSDIDLDAKDLTTDKLSVTVQADALTNIPLTLKANSFLSTRGGGNRRYVGYGS